MEKIYLIKGFHPNDFKKKSYYFKSSEKIKENTKVYVDSKLGKTELIVTDCITILKDQEKEYLEKFGLVLKDVAKQFSKKFACSCTVTKEDNGTECITLTGEFADDVFDFLTTTFPNIKPENCQVKISKK